MTRKGKDIKLVNRKSGTWGSRRNLVRRRLWQALPSKTKVSNPHGHPHVLCHHQHLSHTKDGIIVLSTIAFIEIPRYIACSIYETHEKDRQNENLLKMAKIKKTSRGPSSLALQSIATSIISSTPTIGCKLVRTLDKHQARFESHIGDLQYNGIMLFLPPAWLGFSLRFLWSPPFTSTSFTS